MAIKVLIPTALRQYANNSDTLELNGNDVQAVLTQLISDFPQLRNHLLSEDGELRSFVNIYVNEEDIRYLKKKQTPLVDGDVLMIVPAVAGGKEDTKGSDALPKAGGELTSEEVLRYSRHLIMPEVAISGQKKLKQAKVLLIGAGGLGSSLGIYLAAAGVGQLGIVDQDIVEHSNLQRQVLHSTSDIGRPKLESAEASINSINPNVKVVKYETFLQTSNALEILDSYDIVIDGTDNFSTRYLVNDACVLLGKPNIYGSIFRFEGQASVFYAKEGPCYRCLYPEPPPPGLVPSCAEGGVLGILPGTIGLIQATEAIKLLLGIGQTLIGRLLLYDALTMKYREMKLRKNPDCPICGSHPIITELIDYEEFCGVSEMSGLSLEPEWEMTPTSLQKEIQDGKNVTLLDVREPHEEEICKIENSNLIPLGQLETRINELDREWRIVAYCRSGVRSGQAVKFLREAGFANTRNLVGGILAWSDQVDPSIPKY